jgi:hypothetical protein
MDQGEDAVKVRVTVTLDIDPEAWIAEYGTTHDGVRSDVVEYVTNSVHVQLGGLGVLNTPPIGWG